MSCVNRLAATGATAALILVSLATIPTNSLAGPDGAWTSLVPLRPSPRMYHAAVYDPDGNRMVVFGGHPSFLDDAWQLSLSVSPAWSYLKAAGSPPSPRWGHAAVYDPVRKRMLVFGGLNGANVNLNDVWALTLTGVPTWSRLLPSGTPPAGRRNFSWVYDPVRDRVLLFGGADNWSFFPDLWALSLSGAPAWTQLSPSGPVPAGRDLAAATYDPVGDRLILFGGWSGSAYLSDTWELPLSGPLAWNPLSVSGTPPGPRRDMCASYDPVSSRIVFFGGLDGTYLQEVWALTLGATPAWHTVTPASAGPSGRHSQTGVYDPAQHRMLVFGGYDLGYRSDAWSLSLAAGSEAWSEIAPAAPAVLLPSPRRDYATALDGVRHNEIVFGGLGAGGYLNETWTLGLGASPGWTQLLPSGPIPSGRHSHSGIYDATDDRFIVFGGYDLNYRNDVWSLAPGPSPAWTPLSPTGPLPSPRMYHSSIVDPLRHRMIVFGGHPSFLNDLWALSLGSTPAWTPLAPAGTPPSPRWGHAAVYDPVRDRMLVFGGLDNAANRSDLWSVNLAGPPVWSQVPVSGPVPVGRRNHTIVYDPYHDRLVLFGGFGENGAFLDDVWELPLSSPAAWRLMSPSGGGPNGRNQITAVFDPPGQRMVVFGGWSGKLFLDETWFLAWDQPTPVMATVATSDVSQDRVRLTWFAAEAPSGPCSVMRREGAGAWTELARLAFDGAGRLTFEDREVRAGATYTYGLLAAGDPEPSALYEVEVPRGAALSLAGLVRNPSLSNLAIRFSLPDASPARLEAMDVAGRAVFRGEVGSLGAGAHVVDAGRAEPGIYWIRLTRGAQVLTARGAVVR